MKLYLIATFCLFSANALALNCPDFNGRFKWTDEQNSSTYIKNTITQTACTDLQEEFDQGWGFTVVHRHILDGTKRLVEKDGSFEVYETATIDAKGLHIVEERHAISDQTGEPVVFTLMMEITMRDVNHVIIERSWADEKGAPEQTIYKRL